VEEQSEEVHNKKRKYSCGKNKRRTTHIKM